MQHVSYTYVDALTGRPSTEGPMSGGPLAPQGVVFGFALESQYPTTTPTFYGTTEGRTDIPGILSVLPKAAYDAAETAELEARRVRAHAELSERVNAEHDRRALKGRSFAVEGIGDVPLEGSEKTQVVLLALKDTARDLRDAGVTAPLLMFTDRDGTDRRMNAVQMIALVNAGKTWMQQVHEAKRTLKDQDPIPADFADDRHWPSIA